jgi:phosphoribosylformylglycinamidine synthase
MKARVHVFYKDSVFDPQGSTVSATLKRNGFPSVQGVRVGKVIDIEVEAGSLDDAKREVERMCQKILVNPVIESFKVELLK